MIGDVIISMFRSPVTEMYPKERCAVPQRLRGYLGWDRQLCTGCGVCKMDCPSNALDMIVIDKKNKQFVLRYHLDRCTFCAQCVSSCMQGSLKFTNDEWEFSALKKDCFIIHYGDPKDVEHVLAGSIENQDVPNPSP
jgi:formate hydrogenlyase subunit 6/NADH:ubiquinone oxidoreductase subunit I